VSEARRTGKRFPLALPITIRKGKNVKTAAGTTKDVSAAGVYIQADSRLEIGSTVEFDITLPGDIVGTKRDVEIHCKGRVVRMEPSRSKGGSRNGVACVIDAYKFVRKK